MTIRSIHFTYAATYSHLLASLAFWQERPLAALASARLVVEEATFLINQLHNPLKATDYSAVRITVTNDADSPLVSGIERILKLEQDIAKAIRIRNSVLTAVNHLPAPYPSLIQQRWIEGKSVGDIAKRIGYSYEYTRRELIKAEEAFRKEWEKDRNDKRR